MQSVCLCFHSIKSMLLGLSSTMSDSSLSWVYIQSYMVNQDANDPTFFFHFQADTRHGFRIWQNCKVYTSCNYIVQFLLFPLTHCMALGTSLSTVYGLHNCFDNLQCNCCTHFLSVRLYRYESNINPTIRTIKVHYMCVNVSLANFVF